MALKGPSKHLDDVFGKSDEATRKTVADVFSCVAAECPKFGHGELKITCNAVPECDSGSMYILRSSNDGKTTSMHTCSPFWGWYDKTWVTFCPAYRWPNPSIELSVMWGTLHTIPELEYDGDKIKDPYSYHKYVQNVKICEIE